MMKLDSIQLRPNLSYEEWPMQIVHSKEQELRNRKIPLVKVLWNNPDFQEATWEREDVVNAYFSSTD